MGTRVGLGKSPWPDSAAPYMESPLLLIVKLLFWLLVVPSFLPLSTSLSSRVVSKSDIPRPLQALPSGLVELLLAARPNVLGARSTKIVRTIGRLALMTDTQGSRFVQKMPIAMVKVGSVNFTASMLLILIKETMIMLCYISNACSDNGSFV
jgi:hypothetical protein